MSLFPGYANDVDLEQIRLRAEIRSNEDMLSAGELHMDHRCYKRLQAFSIEKEKTRF